MKRLRTLGLGLTILLFYATIGSEITVVQGLEVQESGSGKESETALNDFVLYQGVQGVPGEDFPVYSTIPRTTFSCRDVDAGYYADLETDCQVFHICNDGRKISFLCPNGTIFQQSDLICEWWFKVNCTNSPNLYEESAEHLKEEEAKRKANRRRLENHNNHDHGAVMRMEEHHSVSVSSQTARNFEVHGDKKFERKHNQQYEQQQQPQQQDHGFVEEQNKFDRGLKKYEQRNRFSQKETVFCGDRACGRNRQGSKVVADKAYEEKPKSSGGSLSKNDILESKLEPNDSDEAQITQETASFYKNRVNNIPPENKPSTANPYPNHRQTYSDLKDPNNYSQYTSTTNSYTTKAFNNGQPFVGASVSTTDYQSATTEIPSGKFSNNNAPTTYSPATYKSQKAKATFENNQHFGARISGNSQRNLVLSAGSTTQRSEEFTATSTIPSVEAEKNNQFGYSNSRNQETTTAVPTTFNDVQNQQGTYNTFGGAQFSQTSQTLRANDLSTQQPFYSTGVENQGSPTTTVAPSVRGNFNNEAQYNRFSQFSESFSTQYVPRGTVKYQEPTTTTEQPQTTTTDGAYTNKQGSYYEFGARQKASNAPSSSFNVQADYTSTLAPNTQYETKSGFTTHNEQSEATTTASPATVQQNGYSYYDATAASASGGQYLQDNFVQKLSTQHEEVSTTTFGPPDTPKNEQFNTQVYNSAQGGYFNNGPTESTQSPTTTAANAGEAAFTSELFNQGQSYSTDSKIVVPSTLSPRLYIVSNSAPSDNSFTGSTPEPSTTTIAAHTTITVASSNQDLSAAHNSYYSGRSGGRAFLNLLPPTTTAEQDTQSTVAGSTTPPSSTYEPATVTESIISTSHAYTVGSESPVPSTFVPRGGYSVSSTAATPFTSEYSTQQPTSRGEGFTASTITAAPTEQTTLAAKTYSYGSASPELVTDQSPRGFSASTTVNPTETTSGITTELFNTGRTYGPNTTIVVSSSPRSPKLYVIPKDEEHRTFNFLEASTPKVVLGIIHSGEGNKDYKSASGRFSGFYVTKSNSETTPSLPYGSKLSTTSKFLQPKPFSYESTTAAPFETVSTTTADYSTTPTFYQISSASPFRRPESQTATPTQPTPYESEKYNSVYENVDNMINVLKEIAKVNDEKSADSVRPGLLIPPSASPETLHSLARYFADALDNFAAARGEVTTTNSPTSTVSDEKKAVDAKNIELLLTHSTIDRYKELFNEKESSTTTESPSVQDSENDLDTENSNGPVQTTPRIRQLAQVFTKALSAYLDDPATFRKVLEEVRPTEPPALETTTSVAATTTVSAPSEEDEVLNFSDADVKVKPLPVFPTTSTTLSAQPTWGYILALNKSSDVSANTINGSENLQEADSQSFVSQFNNLPIEKKAEVLPQTTLLPPVVDDVQKFNEALESVNTQKTNELPADHWIESPDATKLWQKNLFVNPSAVNDNLDVDEVSSENPVTATEDAAQVSSTIPVPTAEISYELRSLPQIRLNATQVHGLLIDFMNKTDESDKLQRILQKLNTTEEEFLSKMKQIESNPLTKRLILLLISECGQNATQELETRAAPVLDYTKQATESLEPSSSKAAVYSAKESSASVRENSSLKQLVHPSLDENEQDTRALQLLNSLYTIASQWGK